MLKDKLIEYIEKTNKKRNLCWDNIKIQDEGLNLYEGLNIKIEKKDKQKITLPLNKKHFGNINWEHKFPKLIIERIKENRTKKVMEISIKKKGIFTGIENNKIIFFKFGESSSKEIELYNYKKINYNDLILINGIFKKEKELIIFTRK